MTNDEVNDLIHRLKELQVEQRHVINLLEETYRNQSQNRENTSTTTSGNNQISPSSTPDRSCGTTSKRNENAAFKPGDRVKIINKVKKHSEGSIDNNDRTATVTKVNKATKRVHIQTDNGFDTWRLEHNLKRL
jgi:transcription antitermination factor NusG